MSHIHIVEHYGCFYLVNLDAKTAKKIMINDIGMNDCPPDVLYSILITILKQLEDDDANNDQPVIR